MTDRCRQLNDKYLQIDHFVVNLQDNGNKAGGLNGF